MKQTSQQHKHKLPPLWLVLAISSPLVAAFVLYHTVTVKDLKNSIAGFLFFLTLYVISEVLYVPLPRGGGVSVGLAIVLACAAVYGPGFTALVSGLGMVIGMFIGSLNAKNPVNTSWDRYALNFGQITLASYFAGWVFRAVGGHLERAGLLQNAVASFLSSGAFFVVNATFFVAFLSSLNRRPVRTFWPDIKNILTSYFALVPLGILVALIFENYGIAGSSLFFVPLLLARYSFLRYLSTRDAGITVSQALAAALEAKDSYTKGHSDRVAGYAERVARELRLPEETVEIIKFAAELHDIGKIGISESLLNKADVLSDEELEEIRKHAILGAQMLGKVSFLHGISDIIKFHHEWFDGSKGYPRERKGKDIPLGARILMVCDAYDAMTSNRPYRSSLSEELALQELRKGSGAQFDPQVVDAFLRVLATGYRPTSEG